MYEISLITPTFPQLERGNLAIVRKGEEMAHMIPEPEEILNLAQELKEAREKAATLQTRWNLYFAPGRSAIAVMPEEIVQPTLQGRIIALLDSKPDESFTTASVTTLLGANKNSVGPLLSRAVSDGKIERRSHGEYSALRKGVKRNQLDELMDQFRGAK
jgi:hypothetical protein